MSEEMIIKKLSDGATVKIGHRQSKKEKQTTGHSATRPI